MIAATIFLCVFVIIGGVVMYLSQTIEHGEARFDSDTGKPIEDSEATHDGPARPAQRLQNNDENTGDKA
ncbi:MAG: hypothetical protein AAF250_09020 [Pseudomonadota bacterium]